VNILRREIGKDKMMQNSVRRILVLAVALILFVCFAVFSAAPVATATSNHQDGKAAPEEQDQYRDSRILIEAFVVEVKLGSLYELGVSPIGERPNSASVENILQCLRDSNNAKVITGAKLAVRQNERGSIQQQRIQHVESEHAVKGRGGAATTTKKVVDAYKADMKFSAEAFAIPADKIVIGYEFKQSGFVLSGKSLPPDMVNRQWSGRVCLEAGRSSIAGATQNEQTGVFLVLCADIENR
jgi:hypothetical protein